MGFHFEKPVQYFELKRVGGAPKGYPFAPLKSGVSAERLELQTSTITLGK